jgi:hypothetical protein
VAARHDQHDGHLTDDARARFAQGYDANGEPVKPSDLPAFAGAGVLRSTAADLVTFVKAELAAAKAPKSRPARAMAPTQMRSTTSARRVLPGKIGLAWHIKPDGTIWHNGETGGYQQLRRVLPDQAARRRGAGQRRNDRGRQARPCGAGRGLR